MDAASTTLELQAGRAGGALMQRMVRRLVMPRVLVGEMKTKTTYVVKKNGIEIEVHENKAAAMKSKYDHCNVNPCAHWDGGTKAGYEVYRRTETLVRQ